MSEVTELEIDPSFKAITAGDDLIELRPEIIKDLSPDQYYGYLMVKAIRSGILSEDLAMLEIGPVNHARWNTTGNRFLRMYVSKHGFKGKQKKNLILIIEFLVGVYYPCWFMNKVKNNWLEGPRHCLYQLQLIMKQKKAVIQQVMPTVQRGSWWANSEMVLQTMISSSDRTERKFAVEKILELRGEGEMGDITVRRRTKVTLNEKAKTLQELIDWEVYNEPVLTLNLSSTKIKDFLAQPMEVPDYPVHGQSMERAVKQTTRAASAVYGWDKRDGFIRTGVAHREMLPVINSKRDLSKIVT